MLSLGLGVGEMQALSLGALAVRAMRVTLVVVGWLSGGRGSRVRRQQPETSRLSFRLRC